jgi:hypothetical protein
MSADSAEELAILAEHELKGKQARFVLEYLGEANMVGGQAARRSGYSPHTADAIAAENLRKPHIVAAIADIQAKRLAGSLVSAEKIEKRLWDIARADPRDLISMRRVCCRFCYGKDGLYQETPAERHARKTKYEDKLRAIPMSKWKEFPPFDDLGGVGYDKRKPINLDCLQCFGEGDMDPSVSDTRYLTDAAAGLYAGIEIMPGGGIKVKMHDPVKAMDMLGKRFGMWSDKEDPNKPRTIRLVNDPDVD